MGVVAFTTALLAVLLAHCQAFTVRLGAPDGDCGVNSVANGLKAFSRQALEKGTGVLGINDAAQSYPVEYVITTTPGNCSKEGLVESIQTLATTCEFLLAGVGFAEAQSAAANQAGKILFHAGVTSDAVHEPNLPYVFGITTPTAHYAAPTLKAMMLNGILRVALAWRPAGGDPALAAACAGALAQLPSLQQLQPAMTLINFTYTAEDAAAPGFFGTLADRILASGAQAVVACDVMAATEALAGALVGRHHTLAASFFVEGAADPDFLAGYGGYHYALSATQWSAMAQYGDVLFGSAASYAAKYDTWTGAPADAVAAGASASALTLALALQRAFSRCVISPEVAAGEGDVRRLLFDPSAISCEASELSRLTAASGSAAAAATASFPVAAAVPGVASGLAGLPPVNLTGYALVMQALLETRFDTFFGPVEFNALRRNVAKPPITTQVAAGGINVVLPLEAASALLVMPVPRPPGQDGHRRRPLPPGAIVGVVLAILFGLALLVVVVVYRRQRRRHRNLFGQVRPPGASPQTTLVVTDIEGSTTLWESLPANIMEQAMEVHDMTMRSLAALHDGYESANEGDSFVLAFHNPFEAVLFAVKAQQKLLLANWPEALLRHEKADVVFMTLVSDGALVAHACHLSSWAAQLVTVMHNKAITAQTVGGGNSLSLRAASIQKSVLGAARSMRRRLQLAASFTTGHGFNRIQTSPSLGDARASNTFGPITTTGMTTAGTGTGTVTASGMMAPSPISATMAAAIAAAAGVDAAPGVGSPAVVASFEGVSSGVGAARGEAGGGGGAGGGGSSPPLTVAVKSLARISGIALAGGRESTASVGTGGGGGTWSPIIRDRDRDRDRDHRDTDLGCTSGSPAGLRHSHSQPGVSGGSLPASPRPQLISFATPLAPLPQPTTQQQQQQQHPPRLMPSQSYGRLLPSLSTSPPTGQPRSDRSARTFLQTGFSQGPSPLQQASPPTGRRSYQAFGRARPQTDVGSAGPHSAAAPSPLSSRPSTHHCLPQQPQSQPQPQQGGFGGFLTSAVAAAAAAAGGGGGGTGAGPQHGGVPGRTSLHTVGVPAVGASGLLPAWSRSDPTQASSLASVVTDLGTAVEIPPPAPSPHTAQQQHQQHQQRQQVAPPEGFAVEPASPFLAAGLGPSGPGPVAEGVVAATGEGGPASIAEGAPNGGAAAALAALAAAAAAVGVRVPAPGASSGGAGSAGRLNSISGAGGSAAPYPVVRVGPRGAAEEGGNSMPAALTCDCSEAVGDVGGSQHGLGGAGGGAAGGGVLGGAAGLGVGAAGGVAGGAVGGGGGDRASTLAALPSAPPSIVAPSIVSPSWREYVPNVRGSAGMDLSTLYSGTSSNQQNLEGRIAVLGHMGLMAPEELSAAITANRHAGAGGAGGGEVVLKNSVMGKLLGSMFRRARPSDSPRFMAHRGLRVRMGLHSGLTDPHSITVNKASGRTQYGGSFLTVAKRTSDAANGGQICLTDETYRQIPARSLLHRAWVLQMGHHHLGEFYPFPEDDDDCEYQLYQVLGYELAGRLPLLPPLRTPACLIAGALAAPVGSLAIAFMYVHALQSLMSWNSQVTTEAMELFHRVASYRCKDYDGYVSEGQEGLVLAAFRDPAQALMWALTTQQALINQPWDPELLEHELAEEVAVLVPATDLGAGQHTHPTGALAGAPTPMAMSQIFTNTTIAGPDAATAEPRLHPHPHHLHPEDTPPPLPTGLRASRASATTSSSAAAAAVPGGAGSGAALVTLTSGPFAADTGPSSQRPSAGGHHGSSLQDGNSHEAAAAAAAAVAAAAAAAAAAPGGSVGGGPAAIPFGIGAAVAEMYGMYDDDEVPPGMVRKVLMRGLRMRVGIDVGRLNESLSPVSSAVVYRGKAMNRAARIGMLASASQILCSASAWTSARASTAVDVADRINAASLGRHVLRGVAEPIEVFHCRLRTPDMHAPLTLPATDSEPILGLGPQAPGAAVDAAAAAAATAAAMAAAAGAAVSSGGGGGGRGTQTGSHELSVLQGSDVISNMGASVTSSAYGGGAGGGGGGARGSSSQHRLRPVVAIEPAGGAAVPSGRRRSIALGASLQQPPLQQLSRYHQQTHHGPNQQHEHHHRHYSLQSRQTATTVAAAAAEAAARSAAMSEPLEVLAPPVAIASTSAGVSDTDAVVTVVATGVPATSDAGATSAAALPSAAAATSLEGAFNLNPAPSPTGSSALEALASAMGSPGAGAGVGAEAAESSGRRQTSAVPREVSVPMLASLGPWCDEALYASEEQAGAAGGDGHPGGPHYRSAAGGPAVGAGGAGGDGGFEMRPLVGDTTATGRVAASGVRSRPCSSVGGATSVSTTTGGGGGGGGDGTTSDGRSTCPADGGRALRHAIAAAATAGAGMPPAAEGAVFPQRRSLASSSPAGYGAADLEAPGTEATVTADTGSGLGSSGGAAAGHPPRRVLHTARLSGPNSYFRDQSLGGPSAAPARFQGGSTYGGVGAGSAPIPAHAGGPSNCASPPSGPQSAGVAMSNSHSAAGGGGVGGGRSAATSGTGAAGGGAGAGPSSSSAGGLFSGVRSMVRREGLSAAVAALGPALLSLGHLHHHHHHHNNSHHHHPQQSSRGSTSGAGGAQPHGQAASPGQQHPNPHAHSHSQLPYGGAADAPRRTRRRSVLHTRAATSADPPSGSHRTLMSTTSVGRHARLGGALGALQGYPRRMSNPVLDLLPVAAGPTSPPGRTSRTTAQRSSQDMGSAGGIAVSAAGAAGGPGGAYQSGGSMTFVDTLDGPGGEAIIYSYGTGGEPWMMSDPQPEEMTEVEEGAAELEDRGWGTGVEAVGDQGPGQRRVRTLGAAVPWLRSPEDRAAEGSPAGGERSSGGSGGGGKGRGKTRGERAEEKGGVGERPSG